MGWTQKQLILAFTLVATGSINTLAGSWADNTAAEGSNGTVRDFNHPFFQAVCMFLGEMMCLLAYGVMHFYKKRKRDKEAKVTGVEITKKKKRFNPLVFLPPALCDMCATSLMYVGLVMTYPSSYQMLRGALIIFTGLLSVAFLNRTLRAYQWTGIILVIIGLVVVGLADIVMMTDADSMEKNSVITGDLLIIIAQVIAATQMVLEERFVTKQDIHPLAAVGCEGVFGFVILGTLLAPMYYIYVPGNFSTNPKNRLEDIVDAFVQLGNSWELMVATIGSILSISFFNFAGVSVTKEISATTRTVLDSIRTLIVWVVSLGVGWEDFQYLQVIGFVVLVCGMFVYNDIILTPFMREKGWLPWKACYPPDNDSQEKIVESRKESIEDGSHDGGLVNPVGDILATE